MRFTCPLLLLLLLLLLRPLLASLCSHRASLDFSCQLTSSVGIAGTASSRSNWALPGFNQRNSDRSGHRRASAGEVLIAVGIAGPQLPAPDPSGHCRAPTGEAPIAVGIAGPQPAMPRSQWAPPGPTARKKVRITISPARDPKQCGRWNWEEDTVS